MKAKRFILMLLVMLGSVTGAWADEVEFSYFYFQWVGSGPHDIENAAKIGFNGKMSMSNNFVRIDLGSNSGYIVHDNGREQALDGSGRTWVKANATASSFTVTNLDIDHVTIQNIQVNGTNSFTYPNGQPSETYYLSTSGELVELSKIKVTYTTNHEHSMSEWKHDDNNHWHECVGGGVCTNGDSYHFDQGNHVYANVLDQGEAYYSCNVCGYVNNARKTQYENLDFLTMKAVGGNVTIGVVKAGNPDNYDLQYSFDRANWTSVALASTNDNMVEIVSGKTCYFRHGTTTAIDRISQSTADYWTFTMTGTGTIEAGGNIMSLLDFTTKKTNVGAYAFANLFKGCSKLTKAPKLPSTSTSERCYMGMFEETGLIDAPALPATKVIEGAYQNMFRNCLNLEKAPNLPATSVKYLGYNNMFYGCKTIKEVTIGNITDIEDPNAFADWLYGTAYETEGTLIAPDAMVGNTGISLPSNWMYKQIKDYITSVSNATEGTASVIQSIGEDYIQQIKSATSNATAKSLRDKALSDINTLKEYNSQIDAGQFNQPTEPGMRLKVKTKDGKVYEFSTKDIESTEYYRATE